MRNLIRHKREYPDPREPIAGAGGLGLGSDPAGTATDDDYELRRARTPVPTFVAEAVEAHLARIYSREVHRVGPPRLMAWWADVDGCGTTIDHWMAEVVAPLLLVLGQVDLVLDHPPAPEGASVGSRADVERLGLDRCLAAVILPEDMVWWRLDATGTRYVECLVREWVEPAPGAGEGAARERYRHWTASGSTLYDDRGEVVVAVPHPYGRVPIVRVFDGRKPRCRNVGQSRYEGIAERQREYYNRDSELILADTAQAHPLLQGPEDYVQADGTVPVGPSWLLPKKKNVSGGAASYEGFDVVAFPKEGSESIRKNKADLRADVDRDAALVRRGGREGAAQSGLAKLIDHADGNNRLAKIAKVLARAEQATAALALAVLHDGDEAALAAAAFEVSYPGEFDLYTASDVAGAAGDLQAVAARSGAMPEVERLLLARLVRLCLPGLSDGQYARCDAEITSYLTRRAGASSAEPVGAPERPYSADVHRW